MNKIIINQTCHHWLYLTPEYVVFFVLTLLFFLTIAISYKLFKGGK